MPMRSISCRSGLLFAATSSMADFNSSICREEKMPPKKQAFLLQMEKTNIVLQQEHAKNMYIMKYNVHINIWDENTMIMRLQFLNAKCSQCMSAKNKYEVFVSRD